MASQGLTEEQYSTRRRGRGAVSEGWVPGRENCMGRGWSQMDAVGGSWSTKCAMGSVSRGG